MIYIVEDDEAVSDSLTTVLKTSSYDTTCFGSAEDFLKVEVRPESSCVVVDLRLPGMSGADLLDELINRGIDIPAIVITGHGDSQIISRVSQLESVWFLEKPCDPHRLLTIVATAINREPT